jgi:hypothetical protein
MDSLVGLTIAATSYIRVEVMDEVSVKVTITVALRYCTCNLG